MGFGSKDTTEEESKDKTEARKEKKRRKPEAGDAQGIYWTIFWIFCIIISIILIIASCFFINDFNKNIKKHNVKYPWPKMSELFPSICILPIVIIFKITIEHLSKGFVESCLSKKYKNPKSIEMKELGDIYRHKLARHVYKITFYTGITIFGYWVLKDLPYFPKSMGGKGYMPAMFLPGFPNSYFHEKPPLFNFYYNLNLAYFVCDFIFLFISEKNQSDFVNMLLHHICTISLIIFSFITNYSNIGCLVIFCHMESDILLHTERFLLQTDKSIYVLTVVGIIFVSNFIYMRQYVFGDMIYTIYKYITWKWGIITTMLWLFLVILYIMHLRWSYILLYKTSELVFEKKRIKDDIKFDDLIDKDNKDNDNDNKDKKHIN